MPENDIRKYTTGIRARWQDNRDWQVSIDGVQVSIDKARMTPEADTRIEISPRCIKNRSTEIACEYGSE